MSRLPWWQFIELWQCRSKAHAGVAGGCWSSSHLALAEVQREASRCADSCHCWRHAVIGYATDNGRAA